MPARVQSWSVMTTLCIKYKLCMMMRWCQDGTASQYLAVHWSSLSPHHDSIFVRLPAIIWQCRHIGGPHMVVGHLLLLVRRCGTHCQNVYVIPLLVLLFLAIFWEHSSSQSTSVSSSLEALTMMHYINPHFILHYITWLADIILSSLIF